ncbi:hypothetical protein N7490_009755 [Penicillium lividum]|nr:hypothetical protein N7490_009755 [Penicillium lividum]
MASAASRARPDIESPSPFVEINPVSRRPSLGNSTYDFHQALRETASVENNISNLSSCSIPDSSAEKSGRPRVGSADTKSTAEMTLMESAK